MARIKLHELKLAHEKKTGTKPRNAEIAVAVFGPEKKDAPSEARQKSLLASWNTGKEEPGLARLRRIAKFFKETDLELLSAD